MAMPKLTKERCEQTIEWLAQHGWPAKSATDVATAHGREARTVRDHIQKYKDRFDGDPEKFAHSSLRKAEQFEIAKELPDKDLDVEDIIAHRIKQYDQYSKAKEARKLIPVKINIDGPIAISHFGDPHVDDDGTDLGAIYKHADIINGTEGMFGANIGDTSNNWVGRLARLYGDQGTTAKQAWMITEHFLKYVKWLYVISGNHDAWSGAGDPLNWILKNCPGVSGSSQARLALQFANGREVRINARHNFPGHSMYNPAHGPNKAAMNGWRDHVLIAGHTHQTGYSLQKDPMTGLVSHCIRVASYKVHDRYAEELGLDDKSFGPNVVTIINPYAKTEIGLVKVEFDVQEGADLLTWMRKKWKEGKKCE